MDTDENENQQANDDRLVICLLIYCTSFLLSVWVANVLGMSLFFPLAAYTLATVVSIVTHYLLRGCPSLQQAAETAHSPLLHRRQTSVDSGYTSNYGTITNGNTQLDLSNDERFCQLCTLKEQEKVLKAELAKLEVKANEAYSKHSNASQFLCDHDAHKSEASKVIFDGFKDASRAWYAADQERAAKKKELLSHQQKIQTLRAEMDEHFWDLV
ncbi:hypothetical protein ONS95_008519 [Cadophora gregata]|uniref:uncharacterized protein n=1 Tax=Cadophora gregata TaxID=51156 RepID=UPI0026DC1D52|nr:uncharacterized protein ONS95_008519 [Cadophora gregata]KAK0100181.1 hypothetical protein ONS95_008519 [Cadophora gregata]KAK0114871.1 hypothetical protein ONS96_013351 [Cadophora gregata f. sp. sojae]